MKRVLIAMACMSIIGATALAQEQTEAEKEKYKDNSLVKTDKQRRVAARPGRT